MKNTSKKILYIHGFASSFKPNSEKILGLKRLGEVLGVNLDYTESPGVVFRKIEAVVQREHVDVLAGTSLGGYWSAKVGTALKLPFVAMNPAIEPGKTLRKYIGRGETYFGESYYLKEITVDAYEDFPLSGNGLILLDLEDDVLNAHHTKKVLNDDYPVICFEGGSHRFEHIDEAISDIDDFIK